MPQVYPEPSADGIPPWDRIGPIYERVVDLAREELAAPVSVDVESWEDGEFEVIARHSHGIVCPGVRMRSSLRYHSAAGVVEAGVIEVDKEGGDETMIHHEKIENVSVVGGAT